MSALDGVITLVAKSLFPDSLQPTSDLPATFPNVEMPRFLYGDRLQWISNRDTTDWGITIGRFYSFAPHSGCLRICTTSAPNSHLSSAGDSHSTSAGLEIA